MLSADWSPTAVPIGGTETSARAIKVCARCARRGKQAFRVHDRTIEGGPIWVCSNLRTCMVQRGRNLRRASESRGDSAGVTGLRLAPLRAKRRQALRSDRILILTGSDELADLLREQLGSVVPGSVGIVAPDERAFSRIGARAADVIVIDTATVDQIAFRNGLVRALQKPRARHVSVLLLISDLEPMRTAWDALLRLPNASAVTRPLDGGELMERIRSMQAAAGKERQMGVR